MKNLLMSLNQLFPEDEMIDELVLRINKKMPIDKKYKDFTVQNKNELLHKPSNLVIIRKKDISKTLQKLYDNNFLINGKSILSVYKYVTQYIANITLNDVEAFLKQQNDYNMTFSTNKKLNKPITAKYINQRWQVDLIDLGEQFAKVNYTYRYIIHAIDVFSRYSWIRIMTSKTALNTSIMMKDIFKEAKIYPDMIQTDNGGEFLMEFDELLKQHNIFHLFNDSHTPQQNAIVERGNKQIRDLIRSYMVHKNSTRIYKDMDVIQEAKNKTYMKVLNASPNEIWQPNKESSDRILPKSIAKNDKSAMLRHNQYMRNVKKNEEYKKMDNYQVNDYVYVKMSKLFSDIRRKIKAGESSDIIINYAPIPFQIYRIVKSRSPITRNRYYLRTMDLNYLNEDKHGVRKEKSVSYDDIIPCVNPNEKFDIDIDRALFLNKSKRTRTDLIFE